MDTPEAGCGPGQFPSCSGPSVGKKMVHSRSTTFGEPLPQSTTRLWLAPGSRQDHRRGRSPSPLLREREGCVPPHSLDTRDEPSRGKFQAAPAGQLPGPFLLAHLPGWAFPGDPGRFSEPCLPSRVPQSKLWDRTCPKCPCCRLTCPEPRVFGYQPQEHTGVPGNPLSLHPGTCRPLQGCGGQKARVHSDTVTQECCPGGCWGRGGLCSVRPSPLWPAVPPKPTIPKAPWVCDAKPEVQGPET